MNKSNIVYIVGFVILLLLIGILLFLKFNSKNKNKCKPTCDGINCADGCGGTCCSYTETPNTTTDKKLNTCYQTDEKSVKELCDNIDDCKGYYVPGAVPNLFLPTDKDMSDCTNSNSDWAKDDYPSFKTKELQYFSSSNNITSDNVCNKRFYMQKGSGGEDAIKKLCDKLPSCKGYYKDSTNSVYIVADKDPDGNIDMDCMSDEDEDGSEAPGNYTFPSFYKKQNTKNT
jgi:hypothetical protein